MPTPHGKYWFITVGAEYFKPVQAMCPRRDLTFMKGQREIGENTGFDHWHFSVGFSKEKTMAQVKEYFCKEARCELSRSDAVDEYVWKENTRVEGTNFCWGRKPLKMNSKTDWNATFESAANGDFDSIDKGVLIRNYNSLKRIRVDNLKNKQRGAITVHVYHGQTGTGKTRKCWFEAGDPDSVYIKDPNTKWWDGYQGQQKVIIDEFCGFIGITHLLRWFDRYACTVEVKGYTTPLLATEFWVTSNISPMDWYKDATEEQQLALGRRLNDVVYFRTEWLPPTPPVMEAAEGSEIDNIGGQSLDFTDLFTEIGGVLPELDIIDYSCI